MVVLLTDQSRVGDGTAGQVTSQVFEHVLGVALAAGRTFDEDVPVNGLDVLDPLVQFGGVEQIGPGTFELQFTALEQSTQALDKLFAKTFAQDAIVDQVGLLAPSLGRMLAG